MSILPLCPLYEQEGGVRGGRVEGCRGSYFHLVVMFTSRPADYHHLYFCMLVLYRVCSLCGRGGHELESCESAIGGMEGEG